MLCLLMGSLLYAQERPKVLFGVVPEELSPVMCEHASVEQGVAVRAVRPGSPAHAAGVRTGDILLSVAGRPMRTKSDLRDLLLASRPGEIVPVELVRKGERMQVEVALRVRPQARFVGSSRPDEAVGGDRMLRPLVISPEIRRRMEEHRRQLCVLLASLPEGLQPAAVTEELQAIRNLARDANPRGSGWMLGEAGEATVQFRDAEGIIVLHGANKKLMLYVYDNQGKVVFQGGLDSPEQRRALPEPLLKRLQELR